MSRADYDHMSETVLKKYGCKGNKTIRKFIIRFIV